MTEEMMLAVDRCVEFLDERRGEWFAAEPHHFDEMDDLVAYTARRDGFLSARKVA